MKLIEKLSFGILMLQIRERLSPLIRSQHPRNFQRLRFLSVKKIIVT